MRIPPAQTEFTKIFKLRTLTVHNGTIIDPEHSGDLTLCNGRSHGASCRTHLLAAGLLGDPGRVFVMLALRSASTHTLPVTCSRQSIASDSSISVVMGIGTSIAVKALFASCDDVGVRSSAFFLSFL